MQILFPSLGLSSSRLCVVIVVVPRPRRGRTPTREPKRAAPPVAATAPSYWRNGGEKEEGTKEGAPWAGSSPAARGQSLYGGEEGGRTITTVSHHLLPPPSSWCSSWVSSWWWHIAYSIWRGLIDHSAA